MAIRLTAWLEDTFESELLLGCRWLQDRHEKKKSRARAELGRQRSVYHDNGSSVDVIHYPKRDCALQVLKVSPLTLTDGRNHIISHFTPDCALDFFRRHPAVPHLATGTTIAVRKYTVRFTSYGPPPERLRLVLNQIDWLGESYQQFQPRGSPSLTSLYACKQIGNLLEQLRRIQALEDRRCLASGPDKTDIEAKDDAAAEATHQNGNMSDGNDLHSQMQDTQLPFGTQIPQPLRPRPSKDDEPQIIGVNRLEPVMAGNTKRVEIRPGTANADYERPIRLLSLINQGKKPSTSTSATNSEPGFVQWAFRKPQNDPAPPTDDPPRPPSDSSHRSPTQLGTDAEKGKAASSTPNHEENRVHKAGHVVPEVTAAAKHTQVEEHDIQQNLTEKSTDTLPSWMKGFVFNSKTLQVPNDQAQCLSKETSWLKPPPGTQPFQHGNMPHLRLKDIHLIADEIADANSDEESDIDPSPESLDPSPESLASKTQDDEPVPTQEDDDTAGQVSWPATPEPPEHPTRPQEGLPPDSSMGKQESHSDEDNPANLTSSPPAPAAPADSDVEMEMEESVPQALGEDLVQRTQPPLASNKLPDAVPLRCPIVHVKETPYGKGKHASVPKNPQTSSSQSKPTSSTSIVHSTYDTPSISDLADLGIIEATKEHSSHTQGKDTSTEDKEVEVHHDKVKVADTDNVGDVEMPDSLSNAKDPNKQTARVTVTTQKPPNDQYGEIVPKSTSHATPYAAPSSLNNGGSEAPPMVPHHPSQPAKRKSIASPTKSNRRQSKRRELKRVDFGDAAAPGFDLTDTVRKDREESMRRFREQRNSSTTSSENAPEPTSKLAVEDDCDIMETDGFGVGTKKEPSPSLSPRHQGLYDEPSPVRAQPIASPTPRSSKPRTPSKARSGGTPTRGPVPIHARPSSTSSENVDESGNKTLFQSFKEAYPEYDGNETHFANQCNQMYQLEQADKMVPKWQWDDFIIRNRTDYRQYANDCIDRAETPEPYYRFYKDNIRNTLFTRGIIQNTKTLQRALEELAIARTEPSTPRQQPQPFPTPKPARRSLPVASEQPRRPTHDRVNDTLSRPRHSLPTNSQVRPRGRDQTTSSASSSRPQPRLSNPKLDDRGSSGDKYRDFYNGYQRLTSLTGSTAVSSKPTRSYDAPNNPSGGKSG
ncbi:hypothetical protein ACET3X_005380 [Alternaria dauci]|uniref:Telomere replication protein EST3 n=1 Tax=Alternaria dauci TaxID=48095 RepID=A0ABR3UKG7_9PLEO